jgi:hypothetical protein
MNFGEKCFEYKETVTVEKDKRMDVVGSCELKEKIDPMSFLHQK